MADPADLANLRDIVVPPDHWWPPPPGWWFVAAFAALGAAYAAAMLVQRHRANAYRRAALSELETAAPSDISSVLKRAAIAAFGREAVAMLSGPAWLAFLDRTGGTRFAASSDLDALAFGGRGDAELVRTEARRWLSAHRADRTGRH